MHSDVNLSLSLVCRIIFYEFFSVAFVISHSSSLQYLSFDSHLLSIKLYRGIFGNKYVDIYFVFQNFWISTTWKENCTELHWQDETLFWRHSDTSIQNRKCLQSFAAMFSSICFLEEEGQQQRKTGHSWKKLISTNVNSQTNRVANFIIMGMELLYD